MPVSRRNFLQAAGSGVAFAASGLTAWASSPEPQHDRSGAGPVLLDSNENPHGPFPSVLNAIRNAASTSSRYPFRATPALTEKIAALHHVHANQVLLGCGSTELLYIAAATFLAPGKKLMVASPTFETMETQAKLLGADVIALPLTPDYAHDLDGMLERVDSSTALIYICNPNNPTASLTPRKKIDAFLEKLPKHVMVLIDEAYHHFVRESSMYASFLDQPLQDERVIVCRTFSKIYGLAGLRVGYGVGTAPMIARMSPHAMEMSVNTIAVAAASAAIDDEKSMQHAVKVNNDARQEFFNQAVSRMFAPIDSQANFVMIHAYQGADAVIEHFRKNNVLVGRKFPPMTQHVRVTLGTESEMRAFWRVWDMMPRSDKMKM